MKKVMTVLALGLALVPFAAKADADCKYATSKTEMIAAIANSEALAQLQGPRREMGMIEVFAFNDKADDYGNVVAKVNIRFDGSVGAGEVVTTNVAQSCDGTISIELK